MLRSTACAAALLGALSTPAWAAEATDDPTVLEPIVVVASVEDARDVGGSATFIDEQVLQTFAYSDVNRVLRQAPGVVLQEEDGFGLRPNIGIRGSGTDRSGRIALMEDGVLIAPAPYAAPAAYYFPRLARMQGVEVVKGPGAIKYGPLTTGGAINLFSTAIPDDFGGRAEILGGDFGGVRGYGHAGGWLDSQGPVQFGGLVEYLREESDGFKELDNGGDTGFRIDDALVKLALRTTPGAGPAQSLELKVQTYDERSDETYLGLTLADFQDDPYRRYAGSQVDVMNVDHETLQLTHRIALGAATDLTTVAYRNETSRVWYKLNDVRNGADTAWIGISGLLADPTSDPFAFDTVSGAAGHVSADRGLRVRNNARDYAAEGVQSVLTTRFATGAVGHELELSARYHEDSEDRFQRDDIYRMDDGAMILTTPGVDGTQDNRIGSARAVALFVRDTLTLGALSVTPGLRYERIDLRRANYPTATPSRDAPTAVIKSDLDVLLPGVGLTYDLSPDWRLVAGAHRGFANPGPGSDAEAETSWNYEAGVRYGAGDLTVEAIGFLNAYDSLLGVCTASTGGGCAIGDQFSSGEVEVKGLEVTAGWRARLGGGISAPLALVYTLSDGEFLTGFASGYEPWGVVEAGDDLPYLPRHQLTLNAGLEGDGWRVNASVNRVSETRERAGQGDIAAAERIDARTLVDLAAEYELLDGVALFGTVQNVTDEVYNVGFSPAGARPGAPRLAMAGLRLSF